MQDSLVKPCIVPTGLVTLIYLSVRLVRSIQGFKEYISPGEA